MELAVRFGAMFLLVGLGVGARWLGPLTEARNERLGQVAFYVLLPALIVVSTHDRELAALISVQLVVGIAVILGILLVLSWIVTAEDRPERRSVALVQSYHGNFAYFGLPVVAATLGSAAAGTASVILGLGALIQIPLTIFLLVRLTDAEAALGAELRNVATNPILLALAAGLLVATLDFSIPTTLETGLGWIATLALPVALVAIGGSLSPVDSLDRLGPTGRVVGLKVLVMPVVAWLVFGGLGADTLTRNAGVVMFGAPTAVSTYVYATELGGDAEFASVNVFATTLAAILTLYLLLVGLL